MSETSGSPKHFSLSTGGLLYSVRRRIHGRELSDFSVLTQILVATAVLWLPLVVLSLLEGSFTGTEVA